MDRQLDLPQRCYIMKAIQDVASVYSDSGKKYFTTEDVFQEVKNIIPKMRKHDVGVIMSKVMVRAGYVIDVGKKGSMKQRQITEEGKKVNWKEIPGEQTFRNKIIKPKDKEPEPVDEDKLIDWGQAIIAYCEHLKKSVKAWEIKYSDLEIKLKNETKDWRDTLKRKDKTITELNQRIIALQGRVSRSGQNLLGDVAKFRNTGA